MSEFPATTIATPDGRVCKVRAITSPFGCEIQRVAKASKIFETRGRCISLDKIVSIHKAADTEVKTRDITGCQLIGFPMLQ